jgi:uncharacterized membrane protein YgdD (TMEM256/DUF423 family)
MWRDHPRGGALLFFWGTLAFYMTDVSILKGILVQDKICIFSGTLLLLKFFTYRLVPVLAPNYTQHILMLAEVR